MFAIDTHHKDGFDLVVLKDLSSNTFIEIIPSCGGILHSFNVWHNDAFINVIDNFESRSDFEANVTVKGFKGCKLSPFACRIKDGIYKFGGNTYTIEKFYMKENALHGLLYDEDFTITNQYANEEHASISLEYKYRGSDKGYPFYYDCVVTYHLKENNELIISTEVFNRDKGIIPMQDGWHPYFTFGGKIDDLLFEFQSKNHIIFDEGLIPTGEISQYEEFNSLKKIGDASFDDCFTLNLAECQPLCVLRDAAQKIQIEIRPDKSYPYLQLYTPPHRNSMAIENLSAPPDTFNNGINLIILPPDGNAKFNVSYKVAALK